MNKRIFGAACALCLLVLALPLRAGDGADSEQLAAGLCRGDSGPAYGQPAQMHEKIVRYQRLVEENLSLRARAIDFLDQLTQRQAAGELLSGGDLRRLNEGAAQLLAQRQALLAVAAEHECWIGIEPAADPEIARLQASGIAMSVSAALLLYDNYLTAVGLYRAHPALRQHLNRKDSGFALPSGELDRIAISFNSAINRARVRRGLGWLERNGAPLRDAGNDDARYLLTLIEQSPAQQMVRQFRPVGYVGNLLGFFSTLSVDTLNRLKNEGVNLSSLLFGNAVGLVETRRGKLYGRPEVFEDVRGKLRAGDILLEKTPFRLTDAFIPGHWGHVAVWVGDEEELRRLGIWEHPVVRPYQRQIRDGRGVVEALRAGVKMNTLNHFLNVDDLAVLRHETLADTQRAEVIVQTLRQVGKAYDFNFDVETTDRIVCSELVYHAYGDIRWPVARHLGRATISPDNVAVEATGDGPFSVNALYHDGRMVGDAPRQRMSELVRRDVIRIARGEGAVR